MEATPEERAEALRIQELAALAAVLQALQQRQGYDSEVKARDAALGRVLALASVGDDRPTPERAGLVELGPGVWYEPGRTAAYQRTDRGTKVTLPDGVVVETRVPTSELVRRVEDARLRF